MQSSVSFSLVSAVRSQRGRTMKTTRAFAVSAIACSMIAVWTYSLQAQTPGSVAPQQGTPKAYLGVVVKPVSPEVATQLGDLLGKEQGLVVDQMTADSPAAKVGIQKYDILATYDDQKLYSVAQLMKLVRADKAGRKVSLGIIRSGKAVNLEFTLG